MRRPSFKGGNQFKGGYQFKGGNQYKGGNQFKGGNQGGGDHLGLYRLAASNRVFGVYTGSQKVMQMCTVCTDVLVGDRLTLSHPQKRRTEGR